MAKGATAIGLATVVLAIDYQLGPVQDFRLNMAQSLQLDLVTPTFPLQVSPFTSSKTRSLSKRGKVQNLSCENENKKSFSYQ